MHIRRGTLPLCRTNGCYRYERSVASENTGASRTPQGVVATHVAGKGFVCGGGKRGHQHGPLANGRVRHVLPMTYDDGGEVGE